jgi:hypothetical protein
VFYVGRCSGSSAKLTFRLRAKRASQTKATRLAGCATACMKFRNDVMLDQAGHGGIGLSCAAANRPGLLIDFIASFAQGEAAFPHSEDECSLHGHAVVRY